MASSLLLGVLTILLFFVSSIGSSSFPSSLTSGDDQYADYYSTVDYNAKDDVLRGQLQVSFIYEQI